MTHLKCLQNNDKIRLVLCLFCLILRRIFNHTINTWPWGMYCMIFDNIYCIIHQSLKKSQNYSQKFVNVSESPNSHFPVISVTLCMLLLFTFVKQWGTTKYINIYPYHILLLVSPLNVDSRHPIKVTFHQKKIGLFDFADNSILK